MVLRRVITQWLAVTLGLAQTKTGSLIQIAAVSGAALVVGFIAAKSLRFDELDIARDWLRQKLRRRKT